MVQCSAVQCSDRCATFAITTRTCDDLLVIPHVCAVLLILAVEALGETGGVCQIAKASTQVVRLAIQGSR